MYAIISNTNLRHDQNSQFAVSGKTAVTFEPKTRFKNPSEFRMS